MNTKRSFSSRFHRGSKACAWCLAATFGLVLGGCGKDGTEQVISKRYIHKYGYPVSEIEWQTNQYPGQVVTTLRNGVTVTATYENGVLHGPMTYTHPHSQTIQYFYIYHFGDQRKEVEYDVAGMPVREKVQLSPHRHSVTKWYADGTPMSVEDFADDELLEGKYFNVNHELLSKVERGQGIRLCYTQQGILLSKDFIQRGYLQKQENFYSTGVLQSITLYDLGRKNGERQTFTEKQEPLAIEEWVDDTLYGKATYFLNGLKQAEVYYINGAKNGIETQYIDGKIVEQEISWNNNRRHGPTKFYIGDTVVKTEWYYDGKQVSKKRYDELDLLDQNVLQATLEMREHTQGQKQQKEETLFNGENEEEAGDLAQNS